MSRLLQPLLPLILSGVQVRAQIHVLIGSVLIRHQGGSVGLVGGLRQSLAAGWGLGTLLQLRVQGLDDFVFVLKLLTQPV